MNPPPSFGEQFFVAYHSWWPTAAGKAQALVKYPDLENIFVLGHIVEVDYGKKKATICFATLAINCQKDFRFFTNSYVHRTLPIGCRLLDLEEYCLTEGAHAKLVDPNFDDFL